MIPGLTDAVQVLQAPQITGYGGTKVADWPNAQVIATLPAAVAHADTALSTTAGAYVLTTSLRVVIPPFTFPSPHGLKYHRIRLAGVTYDLDGAPITYRLAGTDHHTTVPLKAVT